MFCGTICMILIVGFPALSWRFFFVVVCGGIVSPLEMILCVPVGVCVLFSQHQKLLLRNDENRAITRERDRPKFAMPLHFVQC